MEVVRFYANDGKDLEVLAKYVRGEDLGRRKLTAMCKVLGKKPPEGADLVQFFNQRILKLDRKLYSEGYVQIDPERTHDFDEGASRAFDVVMDTKTGLVRILTHRIEARKGQQPPYERVLEHDKTIGLIHQA